MFSFSSDNKALKSEISRCIIKMLKNGTIPSDVDEHWGIGVSFEKDIEILKDFLIDEDWVIEVSKLQDDNRKKKLDYVYPDPQLRIQYIDKKFHVYLECFIGKYDDGSTPKVTILSKHDLKKLLICLIWKGFKIYDQFGNTLSL